MKYGLLGAALCCALVGAPAAFANHHEDGHKAAAPAKAAHKFHCAKCKTTADKAGKCPKCHHEMTAADEKGHDAHGKGHDEHGKGHDEHGHGDHGHDDHGHH
jgi:hypothetical protein